MKKTLFILVLFALGIFQSCSITTEITYFNDSTSTSIVDVDAKEMMGMAKALSADSSSSTKSLLELEKLPKDWTSFYEIRKHEGKIPTNPDSIKIMKKAFMKSNFQDDELSGFSLKLEKFTTEDYKNFDLLDRDENQKIPLEKQMFTDWDGKNLKINTRDFNFDDADDNLEALSPEEKQQSKEQMKSMMQMFDMKMNTTLKFENKIKSIAGKHDWVQKIDDHTVKINFDFKRMVEDQPPKLTNADPEIIITTE